MSLKEASYVTVMTFDLTLYNITAEDIKINPKFETKGDLNYRYNTAILPIKDAMTFDDYVGAAPIVDETFNYNGLINVLVQGFGTVEETRGGKTETTRFRKDYNGILSTGAECRKHYSEAQYNNLFKGDATFCVLLILNGGQLPQFFYGASVVDSLERVLGILFFKKDGYTIPFLATSIVPSLEDMKSFDKISAQPNGVKSGGKQTANIKTKKKGLIASLCGRSK